MLMIARLRVQTGGVRTSFADPLFDGPVAWMWRLFVRRDRVHMGSVGRERHLCARAGRGVDNRRQHLVCAVSAIEGND